MLRPFHRLFHHAVSPSPSPSFGSCLRLPPTGASDEVLVTLPPDQHLINISEQLSSAPRNGRTDLLFLPPFRPSVHPWDCYLQSSAEVAGVTRGRTGW